MKIYTKTGDKGETGLFTGKRVSKDDLRLETYGTIDELNSVLGIVLTHKTDEKTRKIIIKIQNQLFTVGADLATPAEKEHIKIKRVDASLIEYLENTIDEIDSGLEEMRYFILPGGSSSAANLHLARTVCRRAERIAVSLHKSVEINPNIMVYLNRLSDLLFVLSRFENKASDTADIAWEN